MKRKRKPKPSDELRKKMMAFKASVKGEPCAVCGMPPPFGEYGFHHAHHVVYQQHLPVEIRWDERNALPVCAYDGTFVHSGNHCHERHHNASRRIPLSALTGENREFAEEVLGEAADDYLNRRYA